MNYLVWSVSIRKLLNYCQTLLWKFQAELLKMFILEDISLQGCCWPFLLSAVVVKVLVVPLWIIVLLNLPIICINCSSPVWAGHTTPRLVIKLVKDSIMINSSQKLSCLSQNKSLAWCELELNINLCGAYGLGGRQYDLIVKSPVHRAQTWGHWPSLAIYCRVSPLLWDFLPLRAPVR